MLNLNASDAPLSLSIEPQEFQVAVPRGVQVIGKATMRVDANGLTLTRKGWANKASISIAWNRIRGLDTAKLADKKTFAADLGAGAKSIPFVVVLKDGSPAALADIFARLPETARMKKCLSCGGPVREDSCLYCGANLKAGYRAKGLKTMVIGIAMAALGGIITAISYSSARGGGRYFIFTGLILFGVVYFFIGLFNTLTGKNVQ
jgi:hypothetical protein